MFSQDFNLTANKRIPHKLQYIYFIHEHSSDITYYLKNRIKIFILMTLFQ